MVVIRGARPQFVFSMFVYLSSLPASLYIGEFILKLPTMMIHSEFGCDWPKQRNALNPLTEKWTYFFLEVSSCAFAAAPVWIEPLTNFPKVGYRFRSISKSDLGLGYNLFMHGSHRVMFTVRDLRKCDHGSRPRWNSPLRGQTKFWFVDWNESAPTCFCCHLSADEWSFHLHWWKKMFKKSSPNGASKTKWQLFTEPILSQIQAGSRVKVLQRIAIV